MIYLSNVRIWLEVRVCYNLYFSVGFVCLRLFFFFAAYQLSRGDFMQAELHFVHAFCSSQVLYRSLHVNNSLI